ncbi:LexA family transcriptional regulator [Sulfuricurvum sp.]|uniref:LexA family transcriptional regulator n=1 Tax=Sulfuricurvum sp. TaxID=2025608 RepID=UPI00261A5AD5|nr:LexA family transcriptional regulator [Sulfuricurvum sp.]MDD2267433.1 LexA family transcriptional regulator [Sulfuricurvum sp.]MDD2782845.1 LexA family transcriptional regulator [Sulfuricurvum sp.]
MKLIFSEVMERLKNELGFTEDQQMAKYMGMSNAAYSERKTRDSLPYEKIITICRERGISSDFIFTGIRGELNGKIIFESDRSDIDETKMIIVPYFKNIKSIPDSLPEHPGSVSYIVLPKNDYPELLRDGHTLNAVGADDDSMEGTILNGGIMLFDINDHGIESGKIYLVRTGSEKMIKRIFNDPSTPDQVLLKSDNIYYPQFDVNRSEVEVIGRVVVVYNRGKLI